MPRYSRTTSAPIIVALIGAAFAGAVAQSRPSAVPQPETVEQFSALWQVADGTDGRAQVYARGLPVDQRRQLAEALLVSPDARIAYFAANLLIAQGEEQAAVPTLAAMIADGRASITLHGRLGYDWVHANDDALYPRMIVRISTFLLDNLDDYQGADRKRVEDYLMGNAIPFSRPQAVQRLATVKAAMPTAGTVPGRIP